jgi:D-proline reductase (dithiol) PrdB
VYRPESDAPFNGSALEGDTSWRVLPLETHIQTLGIAHEHFSHDVARADMNSIYPMRRLEELKAAGEIGELAPRHYSIMGYAVRADIFMTETGPAIARMMREDAVDAALIVPV